MEYNYLHENYAVMYLHKNSRVNAKISDIINVYYLIPGSEDKEISDERILQQFIGTLEKVVFAAIDFNGHLELTASVWSGRKTTIKDENGEVKEMFDGNTYRFPRVKFSGVTDCITFLYSIYCLVYPYNGINLQEHILNNPNVTYLVNRMERELEGNR